MLHKIVFMTNLCHRQQYVKREFGLHLKCSLLMPDFNQIWSLPQTDFHKSLQCQISLTSFQLNPR